MASWSDGYWWSKDGLRLHYREYPGGGDGRPPILCIHGLTRNARDFEAVAERLSGAWRLIVVDLRGRGESAYASDPMTYVPLVYLQDIEALIAELGLERLVVFGTSLGGILAMLLAMGGRERLAGVLLNDIGPAIDPGGLERIRNYVGKSHSWPTWLHAARYFAEAQGHIYPDWGLEHWLVHTKRLCRLNAQGRVVRDYDLRIAEPFRAPGADAAFDLWPAFAALQGIPALVVRGQTSDILSAATVTRMRKESDTLEAITIPRVGHTPTLEEAEAVAAADRLLMRVGAG
jgi:pimeloyl-ACP methyl ester carboxylesterase